ncbi:MAG: ribonuclease HI [Oscillospiraceae bacterium]|nr:ribonuclease HI [Oscillospiraceae bacterium]
MKEVIIYTDGACSGNPGPGGWGAVLRYGSAEKEMSGGKALSTNNEMELTAVVEALSALRERCKVKLYSDSSYVVNAINQRWIYNWSRNGWKNSKKETLPNLELWKKLYALLSQQDVEFIWVRGHADNEYNERCDRLAVAARLKYQ